MLLKMSALLQMLTQHLLAKQIPPELTFKPNLSLTAPQDGASTFFKTPLTRVENAFRSSEAVQGFSQRCYLFGWIWSSMNAELKFLERSVPALSTLCAHCSQPAEGSPLGTSHCRKETRGPTSPWWPWDNTWREKIINKYLNVKQNPSAHFLRG